MIVERVTIARHGDPGGEWHAEGRDAAGQIVTVGFGASVADALTDLDGRMADEGHGFAAGEGAEHERH